MYGRNICRWLIRCDRDRRKGNEWVLESKSISQRARDIGHNEIICTKFENDNNLASGHTSVTAPPSDHFFFVRWQRDAICCPTETVASCSDRQAKLIIIMCRPNQLASPETRRETKLSNANSHVLSLCCCWPNCMASRRAKKFSFSFPSPKLLNKHFFVLNI